MALQSAGFSGEQPGGCHRLPETEQRQGLVNPTAVVVAPAALPVGGKSSCLGHFKDVQKNTGRL